MVDGKWCSCLEHGKLYEFHHKSIDCLLSIPILSCWQQRDQPPACNLLSWVHSFRVRWDPDGFFENFQSVVRVGLEWVGDRCHIRLKCPQNHKMAKSFF